MKRWLWRLLWGLALVALLATFYMIGRVTATAAQTADRNRAVNAAQRRELAALRARAKHDRQVLTQLCTANGVQQGLVEALIPVLRSGRGRAWQQALVAYRGFAAELAQQTACPDVTRP